MNTPNRVWWCFIVMTFCLFGSLALAGEAAPPTDEAVAAQKTAAAAAYEKFKPCYEAYMTWLAAHPDKTPRDVPRAIMEPLQRAFDAWIAGDKPYVIACAQQIEAFPDGEAEKKPLAQSLTKYCETRREEEALLDFPVVAAWFAMMQGRACASIHDEEGAVKVWSSVLEDESAGPEVRKQLRPIVNLILRDLVAMKMRTGKFETVVEIIEAVFERRDNATLTSEDLGKDLQLTYASALTQQRDVGAQEFEKAIARLQKAIDAEPQAADRTQWSARFAAAIAESAARAQTANVVLRLSAPEWYSAAFGAFALGQNQRAIEYYRKTIAQARNAKTPLPVRLSVEPRAWLEMGFCYLRLQQYYEAAIAFQALRENFSAPARERWLDPQIKAAPRKDLLSKAVQEPLKKIDPLLEKSGQSLRYAFAENRKLHSDVWNRALATRANEGDPAAAAVSSSGDPRFDAALAEFSMAAALAKEGRAQQNPAQRAESAAQAAAKFVSAAERFQKIDASSKAYEAALFQAASAFSQAQSLYTAGKIQAKTDGEREQPAKKLATQALDAFQKYEEFAKTHAAAADDVARRQQREGALLLSRAALTCALAKWETALESADAYLQWEQRVSQTQSAADAALLHKFRALVELAATKSAPACDANLEDAESAMEQRRKLKPDDNETFAFMLHALQRRYAVAVAQSQKLGLPVEAARGYHAKLAGVLENLLSAQAEPGLADFSSLVYQREQSGDTRLTLDAAKRLLLAFDPKGAGLRIPDAPQPWQELLQKMQRVIKYADLAKWDRCKTDHRTLIDYLYDTREGAAFAENDSRRPEFDRYAQNLDKAQAQLETIRKNYPDCQSLDSRAGENGRALLSVVEEEIDFRRKIAATRKLLVDRALQWSATIQKDRPDDARAYRELANTHLKILLAGDETPELRLKSVELDIQTGKFAEALAALDQMRLTTDENSVLYFDLMKKWSEVNAELGKWNDAADYPKFLMLTIGADAPRVKDRWPGVREFLKKCYEHGAKK